MTDGVMRFGEYELDCLRYQLRRKGRVVKLEQIPMDLLILLAKSDGRLVSREEIEEQVWGKGVFVDAEHGINTAIRKVRQALEDDPDAPKFVQTVQRKGYRFIGERKNLEPELAPTPALKEAASEPIATGAAKKTPTENLNSGHEASAAKRTESGRRWAALAVAVVLLLAWPVRKFATARLKRSGPAVHTIRSIAVLPLENISGDADQEYFADGMTDELITMLAKYQSLRVISRTSVMQYKGVHRPLWEIAKELGVDGIVEGSVSRARGRVLVRAQLIYAPEETHVWAESYDRDLGDVLMLQQELSRNIAESVKLATSPAGFKNEVSGGTTNQAARDAYYRGKVFWIAGNYTKSEEYFREAIRLDSNYGEAYGGIADTYTASAVSGDVRPKDVADKAEQAIRKGLALNEEAASVHHSYAAVLLFFHWDWESAERESQRALALNPGIAETHHLHAYILEAAGRTEEAIKEDKLCVELDPFGRWWSYGYALYRNRRFEESIREFHQRADLVPSEGFAHELLGLSYAQIGDAENAVEEWKKRYEKDGEHEMAEKIQAAYKSGGLEAVKEVRYKKELELVKTRYVSQLELAEAAAQANHKVEALGYLERAYQDREPMMVRLLHNPALDPLHEESRFKALVKKMGLPGIK